MDTGSKAKVTVKNPAFRPADAEDREETHLGNTLNGMYTRNSGSTRMDQQQGGTVGKTTERR